jgi:hypothetical protein
MGKRRVENKNIYFMLIIIIISIRVIRVQTQTTHTYNRKIKSNIMELVWELSKKKTEEKQKKINFYFF